MRIEGHPPLTSPTVCGSDPCSTVAVTPLQVGSLARSSYKSGGESTSDPDRPNDRLLVQTSLRRTRRGDPRAPPCGRVGADHSWMTACGTRRAAWPEASATCRGRRSRATGWCGWPRICHRFLEPCSAVLRRRDVRAAELAPERRRAAEAHVGTRVDPRLVLWQAAEESATCGTSPARRRRQPVVRMGADRRDPAIPTATRAGSGPDVASSRPRSAVRGDDPAPPSYTVAFSGPPPERCSPIGLLVAASVRHPLRWRPGGRTCTLDAGPLFHVGTPEDHAGHLPGRGHERVRPPRRAEELCRSSTGALHAGSSCRPPTIDAIVAANADGRDDLTSLRAKPGPAGWNAMVDTLPPAGTSERLRPDRGRRRRHLRRRRARLGRLGRVAGAARPHDRTRAGRPESPVGDSVSSRSAGRSS